MKYTKNKNNKNLIKDFHEDYYTGLKGIYFNRILDKIIEIGDLRERNIKILDFGCGLGKLKKLLPDKVIGYDILPDLSDIDDWEKVNFDVIVANAVFYLMTKNELRKFLNELYQHNKNVEMIFTTGNKSLLLNNILKYVFLIPDAHLGTKLTPPKN